MPDSKPNVLILLTDQQRYDTIAAAGFPHMITPNLDRLVHEGCLFTNAYTPNPVCIPARHNLITGLPARHHNHYQNDHIPMPRELPALPQILADHGWDTRAIGKMHFRPVRRHHGFNRMELMEEIPDHREADEYAMHLKSAGHGNIQNIHGVRNLLWMVPQRALVSEEHHGSSWVGDRCIDYLKQTAGKRPFFLMAGWIAPHPPFNNPDTIADLYKNADLPEPFASETPTCLAARDSERHGDNPSPAYLRRMREAYFAAVSLVDKNVGKILKTLEETGQLDNTLIIFTSDHGEMLGDHGTFQKMLPYDSCARIPMIMRYPQAFKPKSNFSGFADLNDILPTVLDVAGIEHHSPYPLPGESVLARSPHKNRAIQYMEYGSGTYRWASIRDTRYKYTYHYEGAQEELFDMQEDPQETRNLLLCGQERNSAETIRSGMHRLLIEYEEKYAPQGYVYADALIRLKERERKPVRNPQFPKFVDKIQDPEEKANMNNYLDEVKRAVEKEEVVKLCELDLESWVDNGAPAGYAEEIRKQGI